MPSSTKEDETALIEEALKTAQTIIANFETKGIDDILTKYWLNNYANPDGICTICGNSGKMDSIGIKTNAGVLVGRLNNCICPNGRVKE